jgi:hypothetical protein
LNKPICLSFRSEAEESAFSRRSSIYAFTQDAAKAECFIREDPLLSVVGSVFSDSLFPAFGELIFYGSCPSCS